MRMAGGSAIQRLFADMGSPNYSALSNMGQKAQTEEQRQAMKSNAEVDLAHMAGDAAIEKAEMQADLYGAMGNAAQGEQMGQMFSKIGGAIGGLNFGGGGGGAGGGFVAPTTTNFGGDLAGAYTSGLNIGGMSPTQILQSPNIGYNVFGGN